MDRYKDSERQKIRMTERYKVISLLNKDDKYVKKT